MKKQLFLIVILLCVISAHAQNKGDLWIGGAFSMGYDKHKTIDDGTKNDKYKVVDYDIEPYAEYFIIKDLSVNAGLQFYSEKWKSLENDSVVKTPMYGFFIGGVKYFPISDRFSFYVLARAGVAYGKTIIADGQNNRSDYCKVTDFELRLTPGIQYSVNDWMRIYMTFGKGLVHTSRTTKNYPGKPDQKLRDDQWGVRLFTEGLALGVQFRL